MEGENRTQTTRNWFQRAMKRLRKSKDFDSFPGTLPPELIEGILERITDINTLLRCRAVCFQWKQITDNLLEKRRLLKFTDWKSDMDFTATCINPTVWTPCEGTTGYSSVSVVLPSALKRNFEGNPFPHKSIAVIGFNHCHLKQGLSCPLLKHRPKVEIVGFFQKVGHFLTTLVFHDSIFFTCDLASILCALPNLKALTLSQIILNGDLTNRTEAINVSSNLLHLKLINSCTYRFTHYILPLFSSQLVSLKIVGSLGYFPMKGGSYRSLRQLSLHNVNVVDLIELMEDVEDIIHDVKLECLSVIIQSKNPQPSWITLEQDKRGFMINFIKKVSNSLVRLRLSLNTVNVVTLVNLLQVYGLFFPNVKYFEYVCPNDTDSEDVLLREMILPWFPKLESVKLTSVGDMNLKKSGVQECLLCGKE